MLLDALLNLLQGVRLDVTTAHKGKKRLNQTTNQLWELLLSTALPSH